MLSGMMGTVVGIVALVWMPAAAISAGIATGLLIIVLLVFLRLPRKITRFGAGMIVGAVYAALWINNLSSDLLKLAPGQEQAQQIQLQGWIVAPPQRREYAAGVVRQRVEFRAETRPHCTLLLSYYGGETLRVGQRWQWQARLKPAWGLANPGSFNFQSWLLQTGFCGSGYVREESLLLLDEDSKQQSWHQRFRQEFLDVVAATDLSPSARALLAALAIGDRSLFPTEEWQHISRLGLSHLFVVSGLHIGLVAGIGFGLGAVLSRLPRMRRMFRAHQIYPQLCALILATLFAFLSGFGLPAQRALLMLLAVQLATLNLRRLDGPRALLLAAFMVNVRDPLCTHNPGFWLSFAAVALILLIIHRWPSSRGWRQMLRMQLMLSFGLGLFASIWFGGLSLLAPLINLLLIPLVSIVLVPMSLLSLLGVAMVDTVPGPSVAIFELAATVLNWLGIVRLQLNEFIWLQIQPGLMMLILAGTGVVLLLLRHQPWLGLAGALLLPLALYPGSRLPPGELRVTVFDVGQGLSVLIRSGDYRLLYDTGAGDPDGFNMAQAVILPYLRQYGIHRLDSLVISHSDRDHASGVKTLDRELSIGEIYYGDHSQPSKVNQIACQRGQQWRRGDLSIRVLNPGANVAADSNNDRSCVLLLDFAGYRILLPGDIGRKAELEMVRRYGDQLAANLLISPHHGSLSSSSGPFLRRVAPQLAIVSAGFLNRFRHPRVEVMQRYQRLGVLTYSTADSGALELRVRGGELVQLEAFRDGFRPYWL
jgi:competence protein ComEC